MSPWTPPDCKDGSDEDKHFCSNWTCPVGRWKCKNNNCIPAEKLCDGKFHCKDHSDELHDMCISLNLNCSSGKWKCRNKICIPYEAVCDGVNSCQDNSDEDPAMCQQWNCSSGLWKCKDNIQCLHEKNICDGGKYGKGLRSKGCNDGSDEAHCENRTCPKGRWKWKDGITCIDNIHVCDGTSYGVHSPDKSDEQADFCRTWTCSPGKWKCSDGSKCLPEKQILDKSKNCYDGSDEMIEYHRGRTCPAEQKDLSCKRCNDPAQCINEKYWCDGRGVGSGRDRKLLLYGCMDGSDEGPACKHWECLPYSPTKPNG